MSPNLQSRGSEPCLLYELQSVYSRLALSERAWASARGICAKFTDIDGNPSSLMMQQDADEFIRRFLDQLEPCFEDESQKNNMSNAIGGKLVNKVICKDVDYVSAREEHFNVLTLEIKGKLTIEESLRMFVEGETLDGDNAYYCEAVQKKVAAVRRTCIRDLPDHLLLHLKRFDFDFETMSKFKLNSYCEFPMNLDMFPYTEAALDGDACEREGKKAACGYELVGVIVHDGCADSGHYFSLAKVDDATGWIELNDERVRPFDLRHMNGLCFGRDPRDPAEYDSTHNAYLLVYRRTSLDVSPLSEDLFQAHRDVIASDNRDFHQWRRMHAASFSNFTLQVLQRCAETQEPEQLLWAATFALNFFLELYIDGAAASTKSEDKAREAVDHWVSLIATCVNASPAALAEVLKQVGSASFVLPRLLRSASKFQRHVMGTLLLKLFTAADNHRNEEAVVQGALLLRTLLTDHVPKHWRNFSEFFGLLEHLARSEVMLDVLMGAQIPHLIADLMAWEYDIFQQRNGSRTLPWGRHGKPEWSCCIAALHAFLCAGLGGRCSEQRFSSLLQILTYPEVQDQLVASAGSDNYAREIIVFLCQHDEEAAVTVFDVIIETLPASATPAELQQLCELGEAVFTMHEACVPRYLDVLFDARGGTLVRMLVKPRGNTSTIFSLVEMAGKCLSAATKKACAAVSLRLVGLCEDFLQTFIEDLLLSGDGDSGSMQSIRSDYLKRARAAYASISGFLQSRLESTIPPAPSTDASALPPYPNAARS